ncbi:hypothetical protein JOQ06_027328, partial [Pogonophryne albipinna]
MLICVRLSVPSNASIRFCSDTEEAKLVGPDQIPGGTNGPSGKPFMWILFPLLCTLSPRRSDTGGLRGEIAHS